MDDHAFFVELAGYRIAFRGATATAAAESFLQQFRARVELIGKAAALESVAYWCETLPSIPTGDAIEAAAA